MAPMQIRNLTTFPIERLCFDLKLEVLEQLDAKDVIEGVKVNQGFQWMISSRPSIAFGHHVDTIVFRSHPHGIDAINIKKLNSESLEVSLDVVRHFPCIKNIRSCNQLRVCRSYDRPIGKDHAAFLKQLEAVNSLRWDWCAARHLDFLSHLSIKIKEYAGLPSFLWAAPSTEDLVGRFIEGQLNECKIVRFDCEHEWVFQFYYNAFIKTHIKYVVIGCYDGDLLVPAIQTIVSHGIPSKNPAALVRVSDEYMAYMKTTIVVLLKEYPGLLLLSGRRNRSAKFAGSSGVTPIIRVSSDGDADDPSYGLILDAGSTETLMFLYQWTSYSDTQLIVAHPGLSTFADHPQDAAEYIKPLLDYAIEFVPEAKRPYTPVFIFATAGMRLVPEEWV